MNKNLQNSACLAAELHVCFIHIHQHENISEKALMPTAHSNNNEPLELDYINPVCYLI